MTDVPIRRDYLDTETHMHRRKTMEKTWKAPCKGRGRDWIYAAANQGTLRIDNHHQKLGRVKE